MSTAMRSSALGSGTFLWFARSVSEECRVPTTRRRTCSPTNCPDSDLQKYLMTGTNIYDR